MEVSTAILNIQNKFDSVGYPLTPQVQASTAYSFQSARSLLGHHRNKFASVRYARDQNENASILEQVFEELHPGFRALAFNTGMSAISSVFDMILSFTSTLALQKEVYRKTTAIVQHKQKSSDFKIVLIDTQAEELALFPQENSTILGETKITFFLECPSNPHLQIPDVLAIREKMGDSAFIILDATLSGLGALTSKVIDSVDVIIYSCTKYIGGHNDAFGGIALVRSEQFVELWESRSRNGSIMSPHDANIFFRSLKTFDIRMAQHVKNTKEVLKFLLPIASEIFYPGEFSNSAQMSLKLEIFNKGASVVSFVPHLSLAELQTNIDKIKTMKMAPSFGSVDSLFEFPSTMSHAALTSSELSQIGIEPNLVRLSVGIEPLDLILEDLSQLTLG